MGDHAARGRQDIEALYPPEPAPDAAAVEAGRRLFAGECRFIAAAHAAKDLPPDPIQAKMFMILPVVFTFMLSQFAAGLVIYWSWNNLLSIAQQWVIMRRAAAKT